MRCRPRRRGRRRQVDREDPNAPGVDTVLGQTGHRLLQDRAARAEIREARADVVEAGGCTERRTQRTGFDLELGALPIGQGAREELDLDGVARMGGSAGRNRRIASVRTELTNPQRTAARVSRSNPGAAFERLSTAVPARSDQDVSVTVPVHVPRRRDRIAELADHVRRRDRRRRRERAARDPAQHAAHDVDPILACPAHDQVVQTIAVGVPGRSDRQNRRITVRHVRLQDGIRGLLQERINHDRIGRLGILDDESNPIG